MLPPVEAATIATTTQALGTGAYFASFILCIRWLVFSDNGGTLRRSINWPLLVITIALFAFSVTDLSLSLQGTLLAFQGNPALLYTAITTFLEILTSIITDGILIFRCWAVCNKSWRIAILPLILFLYNISCLCMLMYWHAVGEVKRKVFNANITIIWGSYLAATIVINIYATSVIVFRIRRHSLSRCFSSFMIRVITESGLLYTLTSIAVFFTVFFSRQEGLAIATAINFPMSGIAYNLILIRLAQNRAKPQGLPTIIGDSSFERAIPTQTRNSSNPEVIDHQRKSSEILPLSQGAPQI